MEDRFTLHGAGAAWMWNVWIYCKYRQNDSEIKTSDNRDVSIGFAAALNMLQRVRKKWESQ